MTKNVVVPNKKTEEATTNGDANKKKRGRPSKSSTPTEQINRISKPQVQSAPVSNHQEQENGDESTKKKRGRPSSVSPKKSCSTCYTISIKRNFINKKTWSTIRIWCQKNPHQNLRHRLVMMVQLENEVDQKKQLHHQL